MHHVIARGIERRPLFFDKIDYDDFLARLEISLEKSPNQVFAWALLPNHFHLLIRSGAGGISELMRRLMTGYAVAFNHRHRRAGHLFQNRFKSIVCEEDTYLLELVRYIHLNPLRAKLVDSLSALRRYPWTGHPVLMNVVKRPWQESREVLGRFAKDPAVAREKYEGFLADAKDMPRRHDLMGGGLLRSAGGWENLSHRKRDGGGEMSDERILGSGGFVESVLKETEGREFLRERVRRKVLSLDLLVKRVAEQTGLGTESLLMKGRTSPVSRAKAILVFLGTEYLGKTGQEMALATKMSVQAASKARFRGKGLLTNREIEMLVD